MTITKDIDIHKPLSEQQINRINELNDSEIVYEDDCPELTDEQLSEFRAISDSRRKSKQKKVVTLRLSSQSLSKAKSLGKGYTSVLSRLLEMALSDNDMIKKCL